MIRSMKRALPAFLVLLAVSAAQADEQSDKCMSMLGTAIGMQLDAEGFDMTNVCSLNLAQLAEIKDILETEGMGSRARIEQILADAG